MDGFGNACGTLASAVVTRIGHLGLPRATIMFEFDAIGDINAKVSRYEGAGHAIAGWVEIQSCCVAIGVPLTEIVRQTPDGICVDIHTIMGFGSCAHIALQVRN